MNDAQENQQRTTIELCCLESGSNLIVDPRCVRILHTISFISFNFLIISIDRKPQFAVEALSIDLHFYASKIEISESAFRLIDGSGVLTINATAKDLTMLKESVLEALCRINTKAMLETNKQWF